MLGLSLEAISISTLPVPVNVKYSPSKVALFVFTLQITSWLTFKGKTVTSNFNLEFTLTPSSKSYSPK